MQPQNILLDCLVIAVTTICGLATNAILSDAAVTTTDLSELRLLLLPLMGALIVSGGMIMLNPEPETRRIVIGRAIFALFLGACAPSMAGMIHPVLEQLKPVMMLATGGAVAGLVYVISRPFTRKLYERAERMAERQIDALEDGMAQRADARQAKLDSAK